MRGDRLGQKQHEAMICLFYKLGAKKEYRRYVEKAVVDWLGAYLFRVYVIDDIPFLHSV
jgi:hypothetical protein